MGGAGWGGGARLNCFNARSHEIAAPRTGMVMAAELTHTREREESAKECNVSSVKQNMAGGSNDTRETF